jgi:hypothetical protein
MPKKFTVTITKEDIKNGIPAMFDACPIALAVNRKFKINGAEIFNRCAPYQWASLINSKEYKIDEVGDKFITRFDANKRVRPVKVTFTRIDNEN